jgi:hypothetical protein
MNKLRITLLFSVLVLVSAAASAQQTNIRVRGTITALDGDMLSVKSRDGKDLKIKLADNATVSTVKALSLADIKPGDGIGSSAVQRDGKLTALEVHVFPASRPIPNEGHRPWDLQPGSTMTNAMVSAVVEASSGRELTLKYKDGSQKILVPAGTPIVTAVPADRSLLVPGEYAYIAADVGADGKMTTSRIQVSKDGVKPPQ